MKKKKEKSSSESNSRTAKARPTVQTKPAAAFALDSAPSVPGSYKSKVGIAQSYVRAMVDASELFSMAAEDAKRAAAEVLARFPDMPPQGPAPADLFASLLPTGKEIPVRCLELVQAAAKNLISLEQSIERHTRARAGECRVCGKPIPKRLKPGAPRKYCSAACGNRERVRLHKIRSVGKRIHRQAWNGTSKSPTSCADDDKRYCH